MKSASSDLRLYELDGLRGLAAITVAVTHFQPLFSKRSFLPGGTFCVDLFFILSGIVLSHVYESNLVTSKISPHEFWVHRFARLYPLHLFTIVVAFSFHFLIPNIGDLAITPPIHGETPSIFLAGFMNLLMLQSAGFGADYAWDPPSWSISVEVIVNFIWIAVITRSRQSWPMAALILLALYINLNVCGYTILPYSENAYGLINLGVLRGILGFMLGVLCYRLIIPSLSRYSLAVSNVFAILVTILTLASFHYGTSAFGAGSYYLVTLVILPSFVLASMQKTTFLHWILRTRPLIWLGEISYSIYLLHWIIGTCLSRLQEETLHWGHLPIATCYIVLVLLFSTLTYYFLESPLRRLINRKWTPSYKK